MIVMSVYEIIVYQSAAGCLILFAGTAITFGAIATGIAGALLAGTAVAGVGFGLAAVPPYARKYRFVRGFPVGIATRTRPCGISVGPEDE